MCSLPFCPLVFRNTCSWWLLVWPLSCSRWAAGTLILCTFSPTFLSTAGLCHRRHICTYLMAWNYKPVLRDLLLHWGNINLSCLPALLWQCERFSGNWGHHSDSCALSPSSSGIKCEASKEFSGSGMGHGPTMVLCPFHVWHSLTAQSYSWFTFKRKTNLWYATYGDATPTGSLIFQVTVPRGIWSRPRCPPGSYCHFFKMSLEFLE